MKKKKFLQGPVLPIAAVILLALSTVGSTRAAITATGDDFTAQLETAQLSVALYENGSAVGEASVSEEEVGEEGGEESVVSGQLLSNLLGEDESFKIGKTYDENISAYNDGAYEEYVRVIVTKSWKDEDGSKDTMLDPDLIVLEICDGWIEDFSASTKEQAVYYYTKPLDPEGSADLIRTLRVDNSVTSQVTVSGGESDLTGDITTYYNYDGKAFSIDVEVDAVQTHNAQDAILAAWGVNVEIAEDGTITSVGTSNDAGGEPDVQE